MSRRPKGLNDDATVRILIDHTEPPEAYHQWVWVGERVFHDRNGVRFGPRLWSGHSWAKVVCNNPACAGTAYVQPALLVQLAVERGLRA